MLFPRIPAKALPEKSGASLLQRRELTTGRPTQKPDQAQKKTKAITCMQNKKDDGQHPEIPKSLFYADPD